MHKYETKTKLAVIIAYSMLVYPSLAFADGRSPEPQEIQIEADTPKDPLKLYREAKTLTDEELVDLLSAVGFEGKALKTAWAIAKKESNGRPRAHNDNINTGDDSYGIFQINMIGDLGDSRREKFELKKNSDLFDPVKNAEVAYHMSAKGTNFGSWGLGPQAYDGDPSEPKILEWIAKFPK